MNKLIKKLKAILIPDICEKCSSTHYKENSAGISLLRWLIHALMAALFIAFIAWTI